MKKITMEFGEAEMSSVNDKVQFLQCDDWVGMYVNGKIYMQGHSLSYGDVAEGCGAEVTDWVYLEGKDALAGCGWECPKEWPIRRGAQIVYVPNHAWGNDEHPDCEAGFITSVSEDAAFCRYWGEEGQLRTKANSERTPISNLVLKDTVPQKQVEEALGAIELHQAMGNK